MRNASLSKRQVFVELYSGSGRIAAALRHAGYGCVEFELDRGPQYDLTRKVVRQVLAGWLRGGVIRGAWLGTICKSWSRARHGPPGSGWCLLRTNECLLGLPGLHERAQRQVDIGNATMQQSFAFLMRCAGLHVPAILENPATSMLWLTDQALRFERSRGFSYVLLDQCGYGTAWRKRTKLAATHVPALDSLGRRCQGRNSMCSFSGRAHVILKGSDGNGGLLTARAQTYPASFARSAARVLITAANQGTQLRLLQLGGVSATAN